MTIQILTLPATICNFLVASPEPIQACSRDYGFDFDEEQLAEELLTTSPTDSSTQPASEIAADEFEARYLSFLS